MTKPTYVLGTGLSHNGSACLLKDGKIVVAIEKERITRHKNDGFNDTIAIQYCLEAEGIGWDDVDLVVQNSVFCNFTQGNDWYRGPRVIPNSVPVVTISHHLAHAYNALFTSNFEDAAIAVVDGSGSLSKDCLEVLPFDKNKRQYECVSFYSWDGTTIRALYKQFSEIGEISEEDNPLVGFLKDSIGGLYEKASAYVFGHGLDPGQLMGLSSFGRANIFSKKFVTFEGPDVKIDCPAADFLKPRNLGLSFTTEHFQHFADFARLIQDELTYVMVTLANNLYGYYPSTNICIAGGVGLNIIANTEIVRKTGFKNIFVPPPANDAGISIGCAYYGWHTVLGKDRVKHDGSAYLGKPYDLYYSQVIELVQQVREDIVVTKPDNLNETAAKEIAMGKVIGWYKGGAEMGPRALGHRSILANPCDTGMKDRINNTIKNRPDFRPFAPAVLEEDASIYFDIDRPSPHMLLVFPVREGWLGKIPAVTHVDGTARVQTVSETDDKDFYELLKEVKRETGIGMVLNTSFNRKHEPIVERPQEAVQMFLDTPMDALVLGPYLLTK